MLWRGKVLRHASRCPEHLGGQGSVRRSPGVAEASNEVEKVPWSHGADDRRRYRQGHDLCPLAGCGRQAGLLPFLDGLRRELVHPGHRRAACDEVRPARKRGSLVGEAIGGEKRSPGLPGVCVCRAARTQDRAAPCLGPPSRGTHQCRSTTRPASPGHQAGAAQT